MRQGTRGAGTTAPAGNGGGGLTERVRPDTGEGRENVRSGRGHRVPEGPLTTPGVAGRRADDAAQFWKRSALPGQAQQEQLVTRQRSMLMRSFRNWSLITGVF